MNTKARQKQLVYKDHRLNEARYSLTELEQKIVIIYAASINKDDSDFQTKTISLKELAELISYKHLPSLRRELMSIGLSIMKKPIAIPKGEGGDSQSFSIYNWFSKFHFDADTDTIQLRNDPDLKPYLLNLKERFLAGGGGKVLIYRLSNVVHIKGAYNIRIYELLKQYQVIGSLMIPLDELRLKIGVDEHAADPKKIVQKKYKNYADFKRRVLEVAKKELAEKADIKFTYVERKKVRRVHAILFKIASNKSLPELPEEIISLIPKAQISDCTGVCHEILKAEGAEVLKFYVQGAAGRNEKETLKSWGGWIRSAWQRKEYQGHIDALATEKDREAAARKEEDLKNQEREAEQAKLKALVEFKMAQINAMSEEEHEQFVKFLQGQGKQINDGAKIVNLFPFWEHVNKASRIEVKPKEATLFG